MSEAIIKKDGTDYLLQTMPLHYPADRVYRGGDINDVLDKGKVEVTADGTKTFTQLLNELYGMVDKTKLQGTSSLILKEGTSTEVFAISRIESTSISFSYLARVSSVITFYAISLKSSNSYLGKTTISGTHTDYSGDTASNGIVITLYY